MSIHPTSGSVTESVSADELAELARVQRTTFLEEGPPSLEVRLDRVDRLTRAILTHADDLVAALNADFGNRPEAASLSADVLGFLPSVAQIRRNLATWMADEVVPGSEKAGRPTFVQNPEDDAADRQQQGQRQGCPERPIGRPEARDASFWAHPSKSASASAGS